MSDKSLHDQMREAEKRLVESGVTQEQMDNYRWIERATLHGGGCSTTVDFPDSSLTHLGGETTFYEFRPKDWAWAVDMLEKGGFQQELEDFVQCVRTRETPRAPAEDAVESHRMVDTISRMCGLATLAYVHATRAGDCPCRVMHWRRRSQRVASEACPRQRSKRRSGAWWIPWRPSTPPWTSSPSGRSGNSGDRTA